MASVEADTRVQDFMCEVEWNGPAGQQLLWVLNEVVPLPSDVMWFLEPQEVSFRTVTIAHKPKPLSEPSDGAQTRSDIEEEEIHYAALAADRKPVWKAIARYLRRHHLRGHRACREVVRRSFDTLNCGFGQHVPYISVEKCEAAQAYQCWVAALRFRTSNSRPKMYGVYDDEDASLRTWGHRLLCAFYVRLEAMRGCIDSIRRAKSVGLVALHSTRSWVDRLELQTLGLDRGSIVLKPIDRSLDEIVIGLRVPADVARANCPTCSGPRWEKKSKPTPHETGREMERL